MDMNPSEPPNTALPAVRRSELLLQTQQLTLVAFHNGFQEFDVYGIVSKEQLCLAVFLEATKELLALVGSDSVVPSLRRL